MRALLRCLPRQKFSHSSSSFSTSTSSTSPKRCIPVSTISRHSVGNGYVEYMNLFNDNDNDNNNQCNKIFPECTIPIVKDSELASYDVRVCAPTFLMNMGLIFKLKVVNSLHERLHLALEQELDLPPLISSSPHPDLVRQIIALPEPDLQASLHSKSKSKLITAQTLLETKLAIEANVPIILNPALRSQSLGIEGVPDLIVRSDLLPHLINTPPLCLSPPATATPNPNSKYSPIVIKCSSMNVDKFNAPLWNSHSETINQTALYNLLLEEVQADRTDIFNKHSALPIAGFMIGRSFKANNNNNNNNNTSNVADARPDHGFGEISGLESTALLEAIDKISAAQENSQVLDVDNDLVNTLAKSIVWCRRLFDTEISKNWKFTPDDDILWSLLLEGKVERSFPWSDYRKQILKKFDDISLITNIGRIQREHALKSHGIVSKADLIDKCINTKTLEIHQALGMKASTSIKATQILTLLKANSNSNLEMMCTDVEVNLNDMVPLSLLGLAEASKEKKCAFYVDFETVTNIYDDFSTFPNVNSKSDLIFMIGVGVVYDGKWVKFDCHVADRLEPECELEILHKWMKTMSDARDKYEGGGIASSSGSYSGGSGRGSGDNVR